MLAGKLSIVLLGAGLPLIYEHESGVFPTLSVSPAAQPGLKTGQVFRDRMKNGTNGPDMVVIPAGRFRMGDTQGKGLNVEQPVHSAAARDASLLPRAGIIFDTAL